MVILGGTSPPHPLTIVVLKIKPSHRAVSLFGAVGSQGLDQTAAGSLLIFIGSLQGGRERAF